MSAKSFTTSPLIAAIRQSSLTAVIAALDAGGAIEEADQHGLAGLPLRTACFAGNVDIVRELVGRGANVNAAGADGPGMPLRLALRARHDAIVSLLLACGAQVPEGIALPATLPQPPLEPRVVAPELPPIEFTPSAPAGSADAAADAGHDEDYRVIEEVDIVASYGLDTNLLTMDLMDSGKTAAAPAAAAPADNEKAGFWKSRRQP
ncbi:MAG: ankyrin repeat domain-containing protein [Bacteroidota bacterium]